MDQQRLHNSWPNNLDEVLLHCLFEYRLELILRFIFWCELAAVSSAKFVRVMSDNNVSDFGLDYIEEFLSKRFCDIFKKKTL